MADEAGRRHTGPENPIACPITSRMTWPSGGGHDGDRQRRLKECHAGGLGSHGACLVAVASKDDGSAVRPRSAFESTIPPPD
ncbi:hypothetical protein HED54_22500 [Ochrobactrum anthropi ATCC 49188]|nr:hypothetical protein [Brucella anthropi ATCC 49188]